MRDYAAAQEFRQAHEDDQARYRVAEYSDDCRNREFPHERSVGHTLGIAMLLYGHTVAMLGPEGVGDSRRRNREHNGRVLHR